MSILAAMLLVSGASVELDPSWKLQGDPYGPSRSGKLYCTQPDHAARTCKAISTFQIKADGNAHVVSRTGISQRLKVAAEQRNDLFAEGESYCAVFRQADIANIHLVQDRAPYAPLARKDIYLTLRNDMIATLLNHKVCAQYYLNADGEGMQVGMIDGEFAGELMSSYSWIDAKSGYVVRE